MAGSIDDAVAQQQPTAEIQEAMAPPTPLVRMGRAILYWVERQNLRFSKVGNPPVYDTAMFPWAKDIEREWKAIRAELDRLLVRRDELPGFHEIAKDVGLISTDRNWRTVCKIRDMARACGQA